jgi:hypothetical protein
LQTALRRQVVAPSVSNTPRTGHNPALDETTSTAFMTAKNLDAATLFGKGVETSCIVARASPFEKTQDVPH